MVHGALLSQGQDELLADVGRLIEDGLAAGRPTLGLFPGDTLERLRPRLGTAGERVWLEDMAVVGQNPMRILVALQEFADRHPGPVCMIGQPVWAGRSAAETTEVLRHEALVNLVFAGADARIVCAYDTPALDEQTLEAVRRVHPQIAARSRELRKSPDYTGDAPPERHLKDGLDRPHPPVEEIPVTADLSALRDRVASSRLTAPLSGRRREDFVLAVNEVAANAIQHGQAPRVARLWRAGASVIAEVVARGRIDDPLVGRRRPNPWAPRGRGLWIVNQLCDLVQLRQEDRSTRLRLHMHVS